MAMGMVVDAGLAYLSGDGRDAWDAISELKAEHTLMNILQPTWMVLNETAFLTCEAVPQRGPGGVRPLVRPYPWPYSTSRATRMDGDLALDELRAALSNPPAKKGPCQR